jgi:hypothetical protein
MSGTTITLHITMQPDAPHTHAAILNLLRDGLRPSQISMKRLRDMAGRYWQWYGDSASDLHDLNMTPVTQRESKAISKVLTRLYGDDSGWIHYEDYDDD